MVRLLPLLIALAIAATGAPPLVDAARNADPEAVRSLLAQGAPVDRAEADGTTALLWAAYHDDLDSASLLLKAGADANAANDLGVTPLWAAGQNGSATMARRLLEAGANPNARLISGETPLMVAARSGSLDVVRLLVDSGADVNARATRDQTALMWAVAQRHPDVVRVLLAHKADVHARSAAWSLMMAVPPHGYPGYNRQIPHGGDTALLFAARNGDLESLQLLVEAGADVNDADAWGVTGLVFAAHSGFRPIVLYLLDKGADPNLARAGFSALHIAILRRDEPMAAALLEHGADANFPVGTWTPTRRSSKDFHFMPALVGATPFWLAARFAEPGVMRRLAERGAVTTVVHRSDVVTGKGYQHQVDETTTVMAALGMGGGSPWVQPEPEERAALALEAVKLAVELGADVNAKNTDGRTALDAAKATKDARIVQFLLEHGAQPGHP